jgi:hypothetical protein
MPPPPTTITPPTTPPAPTAGGLAAKVGGQKNLAILGAGATVVLVALLGLRKKSSASTDPSADTSQNVYDSSSSDQWNQWEQQYEGLQDRVDTLETGTTTTAKPPAAPPPVVIVRPPWRPPAPKPKPPPPRPKPKPKPKPKPPKKKRALPKLPRRK